MKDNDNLMDELNKIPTIFFPFQSLQLLFWVPCVKDLSRHLGLKHSDKRLFLSTVCFLDFLLRCSLLTQYCLANSALRSVTHLWHGLPYLTSKWFKVIIIIHINKCRKQGLKTFWKLSKILWLTNGRGGIKIYQRLMWLISTY